MLTWWLVSPFLAKVIANLFGQCLVGDRGARESFLSLALARRCARPTVPHFRTPLQSYKTHQLPKSFISLFISLFLWTLYYILIDLPRNCYEQQEYA